MAFAGSLGFLGGCSLSMHETWKSTKKLYMEYLNPPASIDYEDKGSLSDAESRLALRMLHIDSEIERLERFLENQDRPPDSQVITQFFNLFPWISGLAAVDVGGEVRAQEPPVPMKPLDFSPIVLQQARENALRGIRSFVQDTPLGPEIFMGIPIFEHSELRGFLVCHFDMHSLIRYIDHNPGDLAIISPEAVLWSGHFVIGATPLGEIDWGEITKDAVQGTVSNSTGEFIWMARFIGTTPLVFASPFKDDITHVSENVMLPTGEPDLFPDGQSLPLTESQVLENREESLLLAPLTPVPELGLKEEPVSD